MFNRIIFILQDCKTLEPVIFALDLEKLEEMETFVSNVCSTCGRIDILINNGGISHRGSILNSKFDVDRKIMYINYFGSVALTKGKYNLINTNIHMLYPYTLYTVNFGDLYLNPP